MIRLYKDGLISSILITLCIILLLVYPVTLWAFNVDTLGYVDEILGLVFGIYCFYLFVNKKFSKSDNAIIILLAICVIIGFVSNAASGLINVKVAILTDALWLCKMFFCYLGVKNLLTQKGAKNVVEIFSFFAKLILIGGAICGLINLFVNINMTSGDIRYGIRSFYFIFGNEGRYGFICACCLAAILLREYRLSNILYILLAIWNIILTTKGVAYTIIICYVLLLIIWYRIKKIKLIHLIALGVAGYFLSRLQIQNYLMDTEAARSVLLRYGFVTANRYFPLGSGFATYGSDMAGSGRYYSKLYDLYNFDKVYGLSKEFGVFLNDVYLGMIVGQLGYFGLIAFGFVLVLIFWQLNNLNFNKNNKAIVMSIYIAMLVSAIGTAIIKSSTGVFVFMFLGLMLALNKNDADEETKQ